MSIDFTVSTLGPATIPSPIQLSRIDGDWVANYVRDDEWVVYDLEVIGEAGAESVGGRGLMEKSGPREQLFFDPSKVHAAILTCGGLCPGLNNVVRAAVMTLWHQYGVRRISGIRFGYRGMLPGGEEPLALEPAVVRDVQHQGGTLLGSSRGGGERTAEMVDWLVARGINIVLPIGGDGTQRGALKLSKEIGRRGLPIAVVGIPKTIDNDLSFIEQSFGFESAVSMAVGAVSGAHTEARDAINGVGLVKVMGREAGFIAVHTALASNDVNFVLIPEVPFDLEGDVGFLAQLERRVLARGHAVVLVAEGAGQSLVSASGQDASGNRSLGDIGLFLKDRISAHFKGKGLELNLKYIDPSYIIRSAAANPADAIYCARLGAAAVHAAMSGRTGCLVGKVNGRIVHIPTSVAVGNRNVVDPESALWRDVVENTGQPALMRRS